MDIKQYLKVNREILTDGAMGTYYSEKTENENTISELENVKNRKIIREIHEEYIEAGALLIRTNTFSANKRVLNINDMELKNLISFGITAAKEAVGNKNIFIAGSIGPIPEKNEEIDIIIEKEYFQIIDLFLENGIDIFIFETFSSYERVLKSAQYIKSKNINSFIQVQFAILQNGETRKGISVEKIIKVMRENKNIIDGFGFNCGTGPMTLYNNIKKFNFINDIVSVLPNAGFPELVNERTIYSQSKEYFAEQMIRIRNSGVKIIGGCCGTTPKHIKALKNAISISNNPEYKTENNSIKKQIKLQKKNVFFDKIEKGEFVIAVELDPPFNGDMEKIITAAKEVAKSKVDIITISDSPMGKARVSPITTAARIKRESDVETMPHICCRDRNITALKSDIIGGYSEDIRNFLFVTGDPIPSADRNEIKSVFNLNSIGLMQLAGRMNENDFLADSIKFGGALNLNILNKEKEIERMLKKKDTGASFFLTQPVFSTETIEFIKKNSDILKKNRVLAGIMPLVSYNNAIFLNNEIPGITIPEEEILKFNQDMSREEAEKVGVEIAVKTAEQISNYVSGFYFITPFNRANMINKIIERLKNN